MNQLRLALEKKDFVGYVGGNGCLNCGRKLPEKVEFKADDKKFCCVACVIAYRAKQNKI
jgi:hypothetical protein